MMPGRILLRHLASRLRAAAHSGRTPQRRAAAVLGALLVSGTASACSSCVEEWCVPTPGRPSVLVGATILGLPPPEGGDGHFWYMSIRTTVTDLGPDGVAGRWEEQEWWGERESHDTRRGNWHVLDPLPGAVPDADVSQCMQLVPVHRRVCVGDSYAIGRRSELHGASDHVPPTVRIRAVEDVRTFAGVVEDCLRVETTYHAERDETIVQWYRPGWGCVRSEFRVRGTLALGMALCGDREPSEREILEFFDWHPVLAAAEIEAKKLPPTTPAAPD